MDRLYITKFLSIILIIFLVRMRYYLIKFFFFIKKDLFKKNYEIFDLHVIKKNLYN